MKVFLKRKQCLSQAEITGYLEEALGEEKQYELETHLLDCELCSNAVEAFGTVYNPGESPKLEAWSSFQQKLAVNKQAESKVGEAKQSQTKQNKFNRVAAAIVLLLLPIAGMLYWNHSKIERTYHKYEQVFNFAEEGFSFRGVDDERNNNAAMTSAIELFGTHAYAESLRSLELILAQNPEHTVASFYAGMSALKLSKTELAIDYLTIARINGDLHYEDASWYLALANLKKGDTKEAKAILEELQTVKDGYYQDQLNKLIEELED